MDTEDQVGRAGQGGGGTFTGLLWRWKSAWSGVGDTERMGVKCPGAGDGDRAAEGWRIERTGMGLEVGKTVEVEIGVCMGSKEEVG